jgi:hypothetical protein
MNNLPGASATRTNTISVFRRWRGCIQSVACVLLLAHAALGFSKTSQPAPPGRCNVVEPSANDVSDVQAFIHYKALIRQLFAARKFGDLDCLAGAARTTKARFAGGRWKLAAFYVALEAPEGHGTEEDWTAHLKTLNRWVSVRPESITARIALAQAYSRYAWNARGSDASDTVTKSGWKLFDQRIEKSRNILEEASKLKEKCPHWYFDMQLVALAQGWDLAKATALFDQAVAFEPDYPYYYRSHAHYLNPEWHGEEGDAEKFAQQVADHVGGAKGDILYFQVATELICHCQVEAHLKLMSWPRIQKGAAELEKQNGESMTNFNVLAYMAIKQGDIVMAHRMFSRIGDDWDEGIWRAKEYFDSSMRWAAQIAAYGEKPGPQIVKQATEKFSSAIQHCAREASGDATKFDLVLTLQKEGVVNSVLSHPQTTVGLCLTRLKGKKLLPPPYAPFAFVIPVDPVQVITASRK